MPRSLTDRFVASVKPKVKRQHIFDTQAPGLCLRVTPEGGKTFTIVARGPDGRQVWREVKDGAASVDSLARARELAREGVARIKNGLEPFPKPEPVIEPNMLQAVAENFIARHVKAKGRPLRSANEIERLFKKYVLPSLGVRPINEVRRGDIAALLDRIEDQHGPVQADRVLAALRKCFNWHATRDDTFASPIVRGMARTRPSERARTRTLTDDEIRALWPIAAERGTYGRMVQVGLLTGQRLDKIATMKWVDVDADGKWTIPTELREKNNPGVLPLPRAALDVIEAQPKIEGNPYVFAGRSIENFKGFSNAKELLDAKLPKNFAPWRFHDLRRTAKTLMQRAGIRPDISERVLGHVIRGVEGVYDRHQYEGEKGAALGSLAASVERILNPPPENIVQMRQLGRAAQSVGQHGG